MTKAQKRLSLGIVLAVLASLLLLRVAIGGPGPEGPTEPSALPPDAQAPVADTTTLGPAQEARAVELMKSDPGFRGAVSGVQYQVTKIGPWTTSNSPFTKKKQPELLGASVQVSLLRPTALHDRKLPSAIYDVTERTSPPYQEVTNRVTAREVSELMVLVDLRRGKVVSVTPGPGSTIVSSAPPPGFERTVPDLSTDSPQGG
jgi:hypothetical protein